MAVSVAAVIATMKSVLGAPYVWAAEGPDTFDCSGLMMWAWAKNGVQLPRTSQMQAKFGTASSLATIKAGDLVLSDWGSGPNSHVGMYIGGGQLIHTPRPGQGVKIAALDANYRSHVTAVRRIPGTTAGSTGDATQAGFLPDLGSIGDGLMAPLNLLASGTSAIAGSMKDVGAFAELLLKLALPSTWIRIVSGTMGVGLVGLGLLFLIKEVGT